MSQQIYKPRVKLVKIGSAFRDCGTWKRFFGDSKGRVYRRSRRKGWRETWHLITRVYERTAQLVSIQDSLNRRPKCH